MPPDSAAIVDPFASGSLLTRGLEERGFAPIAVRSTPTVPDVFRSSWRPRDFVAVVEHEGDAARTADRLRTLGVCIVAAGCELGVELADELAWYLGLPANDPARRATRRDKYRMLETVRAAGLSAPDQHHANSREEAAAWARRRDIWPVIVKPLRSSSSDHVSRCVSVGEVETAADGVLRSTTVLDEANHAVLVQEYLVGSEYVVDTVSRDGRHLLAGIWRYGKPAAPERFVCYDSMTLLPGDGERQRALFAFAKGVLDALGIRNGPAHCELMWVDDAPVLVEVGARLSAGNNCTLNRLCSGTCQLDLTIDAYTDPARFLARDDAPYVLERTAANVFLVPPTPGILRGAPRLAEIERFASFVEMQAGIEPGAPAPRVAGVVTLIHSDPEVVARDVERIRHLERNGLFDIAPAA